MARKHTDEELVQYIQLYLEGNSYQILVDDYKLKLSSRTFRDYLRKYQLHGLDGIKYQSNNRRYTKEFKYMIVSEYLKTHSNSHFLANKYNIPAHTTVLDWINRYTEGKENKTYSPNSEVYKIMGVNKSYEEKLEIVEDYIENRLTYTEAAKKHQVNYNNVYTWVNKYKTHGPKGLEDNRGRGKPSELQTEEERLKAEIETLKARNKWLEMENDTIKKYRKIVGKRESQGSDKKPNT